MTQTRDGYLWLGTGAGLAQFDGLHFKTFDESNTPLLGSSKAVKLFEDSQTNLWIATEKAGVFVAAPDGNLKKQELGNPAEEGPAHTICEDSTGAVWFRMAQGRVYRCRGGRAARLCVRTDSTGNPLRDREGKITMFLDYSRTGGGLITGGLMTDKSGLVWIADAFDPSPTAHSYLRAWRFAENSETNLPAPVYTEEITNLRIDFLLPSQKGGFWMLAKVYVHDPPSNQLRFAHAQVQRRQADGSMRYYFDYTWNPYWVVLSACEDQRGNLIVGTYGDGVYWHDEAGTSTHIQGLSHDSIWSMTMDREGSLWVGTDGGGLNRVRPQTFQVLDLPKPLTIQSVCEDAHGGIWFGVNGGGVRYWKDGTLREYNSRDVPTNDPSVFEPIAPAVFVDRPERGLVGTQGEGLYVLEKEKFKRFPGLQLPSPFVNALYQDHQGVLWVGTSGGLIGWDGKMRQTYTTRQGLSANTAQTIVEDSQGDLWVGTSFGLNQLHAGKITSYLKTNGLPGNNVLSLYADREGALWAGTSGGLGRFLNGKWTRFSRDEGLANNWIGYVVEDGTGFLWLGSTAGLMRVKKSALNEYADYPTNSILVRVYGEEDGLPSGECTSGSQPAACRAQDGTLWFPTIKGLAWLNPALLALNTNPPSVRIEAVRVDGQLKNSLALRAPLPSRITLPPHKESLEIEFTSLNLSAPDKGRFRFKLEEYESAWTEKPADVRSARFSNLSPGRYQFRVKACNEDSIWNETGVSLGVTVLPPFWRTWWFITGMSVVLLALIVASVHVVSTQKLQRQVERLRQQELLEQERARIARDLHDQLGANLTQVALLGELAEADKNLPGEVESHARQISQTARETTNALDEIVWTVNPSNDTLDGLINYICKYAQEYFALAGLRYRLEVPPNLPSTPVSPELRHNLFLAAKESVNNIVKHARAESAWLRLHLQSENFALEIEDDGRGLSPGDREKGRSGLRNLQKRMQDIGGSFEIIPRDGGGTTVRLTAPLRIKGLESR
jgi:signal transduction histidine kinase/ligand-binding sensor domain-containing protein